MRNSAWIQSSITSRKLSVFCPLSTVLRLLSSVLCLLLFVFCFFLILPISSNAEEKTVVASSEFGFGAEEALFWGEEEKIITATRYVKRLREAPAIASVITAEQIKNMGARDLMDVLKIIPGVEVIRAVDIGDGPWGVEIRGIGSGNSEKVLYLIDGHRVNNLLSGSGTWPYDDMSVEHIKRVEVIRGPGSALYGANAFVAVINVVTKDKDDIDGIEVLAGGGSFSNQHYNMLLGKTYKDLQIAASFDFFDTNGATLNVESDPYGMSGRTDDWKNKYDAGLKLSYGHFGFNGRYMTKRTGGYLSVLNAVNDETRIELTNLFTELSYKNSIGEDLNFVIKGYFDRFTIDKHMEAIPNVFIGTVDTKNRNFGSEIQIDYSLRDNNALTGGVLFEYDEQYDVVGTNDLSGDFQVVPYNRETSRTITAVYLQDVWKFFPNVEGTFGVRLDHYQDFGSTVNPRAGLVWEFYKDANLKLLYGSAFRAPTYVELYNAANPARLGNSDLKPETIDTYEASVGYQFTRNFFANVTYFHNEIKDIIGIQGITYANTGNARIDGVEGELKFNFNGSNGYANYTYQYPWDSDAGSRLAGVSLHRGNVGVNLEVNKYINLNSNLHVVGPRSRATTDTRAESNGYKTLDLTVIFKDFYKTAEIRGSIHNALDEDYADPAPTTLANDYPRPGINFMIDARYKF